MHYELPTVTRVTTETGGHIEPPLDESWDNGRKLAWKAAIIKMDTGLNITVRDGALSEKITGEWVKVPDRYSFQIGRASIGSFTYDQAWCYLTGVGAGAEQAMKFAS